MNKARTVNSSLKRRKAAEVRFRIYGIAGLCFASFALLFLIASIAIPAKNGFMHNMIELKFKPNIAISDAQIEAKKALYKLFPRVESRSEKRLLAALLAPNAQSYVPNNPNETSAFVPLSSLANLWLQDDTIEINPKQQQWLSDLRNLGLVHNQFNWNFFSSNDSRSPEKAGFYSAIIGSLYLLVVCIAVALPIGVAAAIYLEEFAPKNRFTDIIEININNLAAVPSIIYGLLGLFVFLHFAHLPRSSALAGGLTLGLMTLPIIIISTRLAFKAVPSSQRSAALAIGCSKLQTVTHHLLPQATSGIVTGTILGMARAMGETAPLLMIGMIAFIIDAPNSLLDPATAMPVQIYIGSSSPEAGFINKTASGIMVLVIILLCFNLLANFIRNNAEKRYYS